jgi:hypothetical protein
MTKKRKSFDQHVVPRDDERWAVKREGAERASKVTGAKFSAVHEAHQLAAKHDATMYVHDRDGKINNASSERHPSVLSDIAHLKK